MIKEPMFISPRTFRDYEQYKTDCARASGWNEAMACIFAEELETERTRAIREKFFVVETEPQTETEIAKAIVHKMIDDAVIAEDAYPDLRQKMHDAVERLDEYYPSEDERSE